MAFADHEIATRKAFYVIANKIDNADKLMTDGHRHRNRFLGPGVPVIDVHVGSADGGLQDANEHVIAPNLWNRHFLEPQPRSALAFTTACIVFCTKGNYPQISQIHTDSSERISKSNRRRSA
jgi:hypothetical protein